MLAVERVTKHFGRTPVLRELSLTLDPGRLHVLFGRNGAGKSTLLRVAATLLTPSSGELSYDGRKLSETGPEVRANIGFVGHESFAYADLTVRENLDFYRDVYGSSRDVTALLEWTDLALRQNAPVRSLSRGMQQRLAIARALLHEPKLLLLDEPFTGLDAPSTERLSALLSGLADEGATILLTTHDVELGIALAQRVLVIEQGRIVADTTDKDAERIRTLLIEAQGGGAA